MARKPKRRKIAGFMREIVAANLAGLVARDYPHLPNLTQQQKALAEKAGVSFSTVQRIMGKTVGATIDNLEQIAMAFDLSPYQLLIPSLAVTNPQVVKGATKEEQRLYSLWRKGIAIAPTPQPKKRPMFVLEDASSVPSGNA